MAVGTLMGEPVVDELTRKYMPTFGYVAAAIRNQRAVLGLTVDQVSRIADVPALFVENLEQAVPTRDMKALFAVFSAVRIHALAIPPLPGGPIRGNIDLDAHLATYARGEANR